MRRAGAWSVGLVAIAAACSTVGDVSVRESRQSTTAPPVTISPDTVGAPGTLPGPDDLPLPGLLDPSDDVVPDDFAIRTGRLANGLRYYIRANSYPGASAELRLAIRAGSVDELGPTTGVAHFVEHMMFNGTERFPENELIATLRSFGAVFGADVNAWTGYDATVYQLTVPNDDETVELGLTVLQQWLSHATIDPQQVDDERGVILDEWRVRTQTAGGRLAAVAAQMFLAGTPYEGRSPIGTVESIGDVTTEELREYYDRYYRPDNAALVVVGDIDVDEVEADIERLFAAAVPRSSEAPTRMPYRFELDLEPDAVVHLDPDQRTVDVEVTFPLPFISTATTAGVRAALLDALALDILLRRLDGDIVTDQAPFDDISRGSNSIVDVLDAPGLYAFTDADRALDTLHTLLDEFERARRFGFDDDELDVARESFRSSARSRFEGRDSNQDRDYAEAYVDDFLRSVGYPSISDQYVVIDGILDAVTTDALLLRYRTRLANTAPHVIVAAPTAVADQLPSVDEMLAAVATTVTNELEPRAPATDLPATLMTAPRPVEPIAIDDVVERGDSLFDPVRVRFANGVTVIVNSNDIVRGKVFVEGASPGGLSLVDDDDVVDALYATEIVMASGLAGFDAAQLDRILASADVSFDAWLRPYSEHFGGVVATGDLEVLMQLIHLSMTEPRADQSALRKVVNRYQPLIDDPAIDPDLVATAALLDARYPGELRYAAQPTPEQFGTLDLEGVQRVWADRFQNVDEWVFVFSGDVDVDAVIELAGSYLGTLPPGVAEEPNDIEDPPQMGVVRRAESAGSGDTASTSLLYTTPAGPVTAELLAAADVVTELVSSRLVDVVRERLGDTYSPIANSSVVFDPDPMVEVYVSVTGSPDRIDAIARLVTTELAELAAGGVEPQEYVNAFAQVAERYRFVDNWEFVRELLDDELEAAKDLDTYLFRTVALRRLDESDIAAFLRRHVPAGQYIQVTVTPR